MMAKKELTIFFNYGAVECNENPHDIQETMNDMAAEGWSYHSCIPVRNSTSHVILVFVMYE